MSIKPTAEKIGDYLKDNKTITILEAYKHFPELTEMGSSVFGNAIHVLRRQKHMFIVSESATGKDKYGDTVNYMLYHYNDEVTRVARTIQKKYGW